MTSRAPLPPSWPLFYLIGIAIFAAYLVVIVSTHAAGRAAATAGEPPLFTDFTSLYAASLMINREPVAHLYERYRLRMANQEAGQAMYDQALTDSQARGAGYGPWHYPPHFALFALPLAWFPYLVAYGLWVVGTALPYLLAIRTIVADRLYLPLALAAPPLFYNAMYGQTGFLSAGLIGLGLTLLLSQPLLAGVAIGLASFKPHFGLLIPLALALGGHWRSFLSAVVTLLLLLTASLLLFGIEPWAAFITSITKTVDGYRYGGYVLTALVTPFSSARLAGATLTQSWAIQLIISLLATALVAFSWRWRRDAPSLLGLKSAILCSATLLVVPMAYLYDLALLVPVVAWLYVDMRERGWRGWEGAVMILATGGVFLIKGLAVQTSIQIGPLLVVALLLIALIRLLKAPYVPRVGGKTI